MGRITEVEVRVDRLKAAVAKAKRLAKRENVPAPKYELKAVA